MFAENMTEERMTEDQRISNSTEEEIRDEIKTLTKYPNSVYLKIFNEKLNFCTKYLRGLTKEEQQKKARIRAYNYIRNLAVMKLCKRKKSLLNSK